MPHLRLLVPDLLWPDPADDRPYHDLTLPHLQRLAGRAMIAPEPASTATEWLGRHLGLDPAREWPHAAWTLLGMGRDPGRRSWIRADPVQLQPRGTQLFLTRVDDLSMDEAVALTTTLNRHFAEDRIRFEPLTPDVWIAEPEAAVDLRTAPVDFVHGRSIDTLLPRGPDAAFWAQRVNDAQMLLHDHPVNATREASGRSVVNSVWPWGAGRLEAPAPAPTLRVHAADLALQGLAGAAGGAVKPVPSRFDDLDLSDKAGQVIVVLDAPAKALARGDAAAWTAALLDLDRDWIGPAWAALSRGTLDPFGITALPGRSGFAATVRRRDRWRFWRGPGSVADLRPSVGR
ncbi:MAG: hypothetical protein KIT73_18110 [Burkholderiales bacterium]|nr:hypothetical protein [Burkholderiales bacterium]